MLELIFQGFMEWAYGLVLECWEYFSSALLDIMSLDFAYLETHVPIINDLMQVLLAAGWALLIGNLVFQAVKSMLSGLGFEGEDPKLLFTRTFIFAFLLLASPQICRTGLDITSRIMSALEIPDAVNVTLVDESIFGSLTAAWLLVIICGLIIMFKVFRLILEIAERYVILAMLTITAPLAFAMGGSRNTSEIFTGWCRMFGSMCVLMALNVVFFKMLLSVLSTIPSGLDVLPWMVLIMTIVKVAKKSDAIVTRIGLNPAITGDNLGVRFPGALTYMVIRGMTSQVTKAVGKSAGSSGRGASPNTPPGGSGGGPRSGGPAGGRNGPGVSAAGYSHQSSQQTASQENSFQQGAAQQNTTQQGGAAQAAPQQAAAREQSAGVGSVSSQVNQGGDAARQSRKSAVPPGTRRAPSHVKAGSSPMAGAPVAGRPDGTPGTVPGRPDMASGRTPGTVQPGAPAQATARQEYRSHPRDASGKPTGGQPGTAGTAPGSTSRFTHTVAQTAHGGDTSSSVQTSEQNHVSVGQQTRTSTPPPSASAPPGAHAPGGPTQQHGSPVSGETRFTHREKTEEHTGQAQPSSAPQQVSTPPAASQPGTAGMGTSRFSERPVHQTQPGRNSPLDVPSQKGPQASSTARQEPREASAPTAPPISGGASRPHPGTAGIPAAGRGAGQSASAQTRRPASTPTSADSLGGKRPVSTAAASEKGRMAPKGSPGGTLNGAARSSKQKRGSGHGK